MFPEIPAWALWVIWFQVLGHWVLVLKILHLRKRQKVEKLRVERAKMEVQYYVESAMLEVVRDFERVRRSCNNENPVEEDTSILN